MFVTFWSVDTGRGRRRRKRKRRRRQALEEEKHSDAILFYLVVAGAAWWWGQGAWRERWRDGDLGVEQGPVARRQKN